MRLAKLLLPAAFVALPLGAQQDAPLTVSLLYSGVGAPAFSVNKAAYVAVFAVTRTSLRQLYPSSGVQRAEFEGRASDYSLGFRGSPLSPAAFSLAYAAEWSTILVVASTSPLRVGAPGVTEFRLRNAVQRQGRYANFDTEKGMDAIIGLVASDDSGAEQVSMFDEYAPSLTQYVEPSPLRFGGSPGECVRAWMFYGYFPWNLENCVYDPNSPTQVTLASGPTPPLRDSLTTRVDTVARGSRTGAGLTPRIESPRGIRHTLAAVDESAARRSAHESGPRVSSGVEVYARHFENPAAGRLSGGGPPAAGPGEPGGARGPGARSRGPGDVRGDAPVVSGPGGRPMDAPRASPAPRSTEIFHEASARDAMPIPRESPRLPSLSSPPPPPPPPATPPIRP